MEIREPYGHQIKFPLDHGVCALCGAALVKDAKCYYIVFSWGACYVCSICAKDLDFLEIKGEHAWELALELKSCQRIQRSLMDEIKRLRKQLGM